MIKQFALAMAIILSLPLVACDSKKEPEPQPEVERTVRERAEQVGKVGDKTFTNHLEKDLTGLVDDADAHRQMLDDEANQQ